MNKQKHDIAERKKTLLEKILTVFPGYRGYREREVLRETDQLIRHALFQQLKNIVTFMREVYSEILSSQNRLEDGKRIEKLLMRVDAAAERMRHAKRGYAPLMNISSVQQDQIIDLIEFDATLGDSISNLKNKIDALRTKWNDKEQFPKLVTEIGGAIDSLEETFTKREGVILGLNKEE